MNNNKCQALTLSAWYSVSQGLSSACDTLYSVRHKTKSNMQAIIAAAIVGSLEVYASWRFQGQSIMEAYLGEQDNPIAEERRPCASIFWQVLYMMLKTVVALLNRYFILAALEDHYEFEFNPYAFWSILAVDLTINRLFCLSNEDYEGAEYVANQHGYDKPFYAGMFKCAASQRTRTLFSAIGAIEHVLVDDLLGLVLLLPKQAIHYLQQHLILRLVAAVVGVVATITSAYPLFNQANLFEGGHTREHLAQLVSETDTYTKDKKVGRREATMLRCASNAMAPLHGISSAISVYFALKSSLAAYCAAALAFTVFAGVTMGVYESETREAKEKIQEMEENSQSLLVNDENPNNRHYGLCCFV